MVTSDIETRYNVTKRCNIKHLCFFVMVTCMARLLHLLRSSVCHDKSHCRLALRARRAGERLGLGVNEHRHSKGPDHVGTNADAEVQWCGGIKMVVIFAEADCRATSRRYTSTCACAAGSPTILLLSC